MSIYIYFVEYVLGKLISLLLILGNLSSFFGLPINVLNFFLNLSFQSQRDLKFKEQNKIGFITWSSNTTSTFPFPLVNSPTPFDKFDKLCCVLAIKWLLIDVVAIITEKKKATQICY